MEGSAMSDNGENKTVADAATAAAAFWTQWLEQSSRSTQTLLEAMQATGDPKKVHQHWLDAVAQSLENFMRTPAFLEAMKQNLKVVTDLKGLQNQIVQGTARELGMPLADDITGLFERLNSVEQKILTRLGALDSQLSTVEAKLGNAPDEQILTRLGALDSRLNTVEAKLGNAPDQHQQS